MIDVCLLGTGGMMPLPNRYLTSLYLRCHGAGILVDCGEATQIALRRRGFSSAQIDYICFTHFHADHISGLPGMLLSMGNAEKTTPVTIIGPKGLEHVVKSLLVIAPQLPFPIHFHELASAEEVYQPEAALLPDFSITAFKVHHNIPCYGYRFDLSRKGKFNVEAALAAEIDKKYWNPLQKGKTVITEDGRTLTPDLVMGAERKGIRLTYVTDSRPTKSIIRNATGADLFICEGMYGDPEKQQSAKDKCHMTMYEAAELARDADVSALWLTHYSPSMVNPQEYQSAVRKIYPQTVVSKDGRIFTLRFSEAPPPSP